MDTTEEEFLIAVFFSEDDIQKIYDAWNFIDQQAETVEEVTLADWLYELASGMENTANAMYGDDEMEEVVTDV